MPKGVIRIQMVKGVVRKQMPEKVVERCHVIKVTNAIKQAADLSIQEIVKEVEVRRQGVKTKKQMFMEVVLRRQMVKDLAVRCHVVKVINAIKQTANLSIREIVKGVVVNEDRGSVIIAKRKVIYRKSVQYLENLETMELVRRQIIKVRRQMVKGVTRR